MDNRYIKADELEREKRKRSNMRWKEFFKSILFLFLTNVAFTIIYELLVSGDIAIESRDEYDKTEVYIIMIFSAICFLILFGVWYFTYIKRAEEKRLLLAAFIDEGESFSHKKHYLDTLVRLLVPAGIAFAVFTLPFTIFHAIWGFGYGLALGFECFFAGQLLFYEMTNAAFLAYLIDLVLFCGVYAGEIFLIQKLWIKGCLREK